MLIGNGINIQFGGLDVYSSSAIMKRVIKNIKSGKYTALTENALTPDEQLELLEGLTRVINNIKLGCYNNKADGLFMLMELDRIQRTYPTKSTSDSVFLEDYFLAAELFNNDYQSEDGEERSEYYRKTFFTFLHQIIVDGIYNNSAINELYKNFYSGIKKYLNQFNTIFTTNYDYNLEHILDDTERICHLHGEFNKLAPEYDVESLYYQQNTDKCNALINSKISGMEHIYGNTIMSWSWLDKYGNLIEPDVKAKEKLFKSMDGQLEILGLSPANDEHLFILINQNPNISSVVYYYLNDTDKAELPHHINKPITFKHVTKLWNSMK